MTVRIRGGVSVRVARPVAVTEAGPIAAFARTVHRAGRVVRVAGSVTILRDEKIVPVARTVALGRIDAAGAIRGKRTIDNALLAFTVTIRGAQNVPGIAEPFTVCRAGLIEGVTLEVTIGNPVNYEKPTGGEGVAHAVAIRGTKIIPVADSVTVRGAETVGEVATPVAVRGAGLVVDFADPVAIEV